MVIAITADRGLCGSFNTNVIKAVSAFLANNPGRPVSLGLVGRKGRDFLSKRGLPVRFEYVNLPKIVHFAEGEAIAKPALEDFIEGRVDSVYLIYNEFKSVMQQKSSSSSCCRCVRRTSLRRGDALVDYIYEPSPERILELLLNQLVVAQILRALIESNAAFYAAQMTAMDAATRNSTDMIDSLTLYMNKLRQAAITREIIEVVSGAQAL
jgi:F-type H+-transporting ATPase subunit gamma